MYDPSRQHTVRRRRKAIRIGVISVIFAGFIVGVVWYVLHLPEPKTMQPDNELPKPAADNMALQAATDELQKANDARRADAYALYYAAGDYYLANNQTYPTGFAAGNLTGPDGTKPKALTLTHYKQALVATGAQPPLATDEVRLVGGAACAQAHSATIASAQDYAYVVQYAQQMADGSFTAICLKL
ncbi:MAG TPA: hypothetical protein VKQ34_04865 [Candidatus Saccharimonadales bacterium]|nr:hypothetical protein [Candidatus Saccharimonadales bacterium]